MLFVNAALGSPQWPETSNLSFIPLDSILWSLVGLFVHGASLFNLLHDERRVKLGPLESALWRLFYRTGGLSANLFQTIVGPHFDIVSFGLNEEIPTEDYFYIIYQGNVHLKAFARSNGEFTGERASLRSGHMFDVNYLGMFASDHIFSDQYIRCTSKSPVTLFRFSRANMEQIAQHPLVKSVWQSLLINNLSLILEHYIDQQQLRGSEPSGNGSVVEGVDQLRYQELDRIFRPLEDWEQPKPAHAGSGRALAHLGAHFWKSLSQQFSLPWKHLSGIRQTTLRAPIPQPSGDTQQRLANFHGMNPSTGSSISTIDTTEVSTKLMGTNIGNDFFDA